MEEKISKTLYSSLTFSIMSIIFISHSCFYPAVANSSAIETSRQVLEIGISIGGSSPPAPPPDDGDCPDCSLPPQPPACPEPVPPPPPDCPPPPTPSPPPPKPKPPTPKSPPPPHKPVPHPSPTPSPFDLTAELRQNIADIEHFRKRITSDPFHITRTWNGRLCKDKTKYIGFVCDTTRDTNELRIAGVKFNGYQLKADSSLEDFLGNLKGLIFFHANSNKFQKTVPLEFNKLPTLYEFDLSNNLLVGGFPKPVLAGNLTFLDLRFNQFTGPVPPQAFNLDLDALFLNNNQFTGPIPENLGSTPSVYLTLANNMFTGNIPKSIRQAGDTLIEVLFLNNQLSGCLPYEIGFLKKTEVFDASGNQLTGPIPRSFGCLQRMEKLNLANNHLYGAVPEELCSIKSLHKLQLSLNYFTQVGPKCRALIKDKTLDLSMNCIIDLPSQRKPADCKDFFSKHPRDCSEVLKIPCKIDRSDRQLTEEPERKKTFKHSRAYAALQRHHH